MDSVIAGLFGGYIVFGESNSINQQIVLYVFSRIVMGFVKVSVNSTQDRGPNRKQNLIISRLENLSWPLFASACWASVMYLHEWHPTSLQPSLASSMYYLYDESAKWNSIRMSDERLTALSNELIGNFVWHSI